MYDNLTEQETKKIELEYERSNYVIDEHLIQRSKNIERLQSWIKVQYKNKSNRKERKRLNRRKHTIVDYVNDPYLFKKLPSDRKQIIKDLCNNHNIGLQTLAFKTNIRGGILLDYLNGRYILSNIQLKRIFDYFDYKIVNETNSDDILNENVDNNDLETSMPTIYI
tara:strand:- start:20 stop:517 length:498 start_codon:yes stop_codon:yes gene_type:complete